MSEQDKQILAQNKRINELSRRVSSLEQKIVPLEKAIEPQGWISQAFEKVEEHLSELDTKIDHLRQDTHYRFDQLDGKLEVILQHITKISDLPEE